MKKYCDLHTHSSFSDGTETPKALLELALAAGLSAVALTDHNTVAGLFDFYRGAEGMDIEAVGGIELSTVHNSVGFHLLGLFIKEEHFEKITGLLSYYRSKKEESNIALAKALNDAGIPVNYERIRARGQESINRAHFASELIELGFASDMDDAMEKFLFESAGYYRCPERLETIEAVKFLKSIGAVSVLAHPFLNTDEAGLRAFLSDAVPAGLDGMETDYSEYSEQETLISRKIADEYGILRSGGSDFHGGRKPSIAIGRGRGRLFVPFEYFEKLKERTK